MTQYYLEKRTLSTWSHVTWYATEEEALKNFNRVAVAGNGYSWRVVKVEVVEERILTGERPVEPTHPMEPDRYRDDEDEVGTYKPNKYTTTISTDAWRKADMGISSNPPSNHGMVGKVWLGNPTTKEKKRVEPSMVEAMMKDGWVKAGPRTVL